jgi:hypothetical protein
VLKSFLVKLFSAEFCVSASEDAVNSKNQKRFMKMKTLTIKEGLRGTKLRFPQEVIIPEANNALDRELQTYVITTFASWMPRLIPFTFENATTMELAKHLLFHRTGSPNTLHNYIYAVYRYSRWRQTRPDQLVNDCKDADGVPMPKAIVEASESE